MMPVEALSAGGTAERWIVQPGIGRVDGGLPNGE